MEAVAQLIEKQVALAAEIVEAQKAVAEIEAQGGTDAKALDAHGRATSRLAILERRRVEIEGQILPAKRAEAAAKVEGLQADYKVAMARRDEVIKTCTDTIAPWFDYPGGGVYLKTALSGAIPVREANAAARVLQNQLEGAQAHLRQLA